MAALLPWDLTLALGGLLVAAIIINLLRKKPSVGMPSLYFLFIPLIAMMTASLCYTPVFDAGLEKVGRFLNVTGIVIVAPCRALEAEGIHCSRAPRCIQWAEKDVLGGPHEGGVVRRLLVQGYRAILQSLVFHQLDSPRRRISFSSNGRHDPDHLEQSWLNTLSRFRLGAFELACHPD